MQEKSIFPWHGQKEEVDEGFFFLKQTIPNADTLFGVTAAYPEDPPCRHYGSYSPVTGVCTHCDTACSTDYYYISIKFLKTGNNLELKTLANLVYTINHHWQRLQKTSNRAP